MKSEKIGRYAIHPAASSFPLVTGAEFEALVADIRQHGLREPILRYRGQILDGRNRLRAVLALERQPVFAEFKGTREAARAAVVSLNLHRRHLDESQRALVGARLGALSSAKKGRPKKGAASLTTAAAAKALNVGPRSIERARTVLASGVPELVRQVERGVLSVALASELARQPQSKQRAILRRAQRGDQAITRGNLVSAQRHLTRESAATALRRQPPPLPGGKWSVIVADPPWPYEVRQEDGSHRGITPYPPMTLDAICCLPVAALAASSAILWLWTTNAFLRHAYEVIDAWGFSERTLLTWSKAGLGLGNYLRNTTEHCVLAVKGTPTIAPEAQSIGTLIAGDVREHSRKPEEFYRLVNLVCPGPKLELFSRDAREGWIGWGLEAGKFAPASPTVHPLPDGAPPEPQSVAAGRPPERPGTGGTAARRNGARAASPTAGARARRAPATSTKRAR